MMKFWSGLVIFGMASAAHAGDLSKCLGAGGSPSCVTGDLSASTSRPSTPEEAKRMKLLAAQVDAGVVLNGGAPSDEFAQAAEIAQELTGRVFADAQEAALAILELANQ